jgi:hypothetical protein
MTEYTSAYAVYIYSKIEAMEVRWDEQALGEKQRQVIYGVIKMRRVFVLPRPPFQP